MGICKAFSDKTVVLKTIEINWLLFTLFWVQKLLLTFCTIFDDCIAEKDLDDDWELVVICCDFCTEVEEDICCCWLLLLLKEFCWLFAMELLNEFSCWFELNKLFFSCRGAVWKPACWKGVPTLRTSSDFSSAKLVSCFVSRFTEELCSAFEKLTVAPRCWQRLILFRKKFHRCQLLTSR